MVFKISHEIEWDDPGKWYGNAMKAESLQSGSNIETKRSTDFGRALQVGKHPIFGYPF